MASTLDTANLRATPPAGERLARLEEALQITLASPGKTVGVSRRTSP
jgi:hypothetical protein